jgi:hypothetical protein
MVLGRTFVLPAQRSVYAGGKLGVLVGVDYKKQLCSTGNRNIYAIQ